MTQPKKAAPARNKHARAPLGLTASVLLKLHPDLKAYIDKQAAANYQSSAEYVRQLIIADMRAQDGEE